MWQHLCYESEQFESKETLIEAQRNGVQSLKRFSCKIISFVQNHVNNIQKGNIWVNVMFKGTISINTSRQTKQKYKCTFIKEKQSRFSAHRLCTHVNQQIWITFCGLQASQMKQSKFYEHKEKNENVALLKHIKT